MSADDKEARFKEAQHKHEAERAERDMTFTLHVDVSNDDATRFPPNHYVGFLLKDVANQVSGGHMARLVKDVNGNTIGSYTLRVNR